MRDDEKREQMNEAGMGTGGDYMPNEAFQKALAAKRDIEARMRRRP